MASPSVTIYEVAARAKVSVATVSRVVNGASIVSSKTRARVERVIAQTGYVPNLIARDLTTRRSRTVGLVIPGVNAYFSAAVQAIAGGLRREGVQLLISVNSAGVFDEREELESLKLLLSKRVEGVIVFLTRLSQAHAEVLGRWPRGVGLVLINGSGRALAASSVLQDPRPGFDEAVRVMVTEGRTAAAFIGGPPGERTTADRLSVLRRCLRAHGLSLPADLVRRGRFDLTSGEEAARALVDCGAPFDALFCANDLMAIGALRALRAKGVRVPEDVAIVGYDDLEIGRFTVPALSSIDANLQTLGSAAVSLVLRSDHRERPEQIQVPSRFVPRASHTLRSAE